jgi:hypothetical protein
MEAMADSEAMEDALSCNICMERFDDGARVPRALNCLHTFCTDCLVGLAKAHDNLKVICPTCRQDVPLKGGDVKTTFLCNFTVQDLVASLSTKSADLITCEVCEKDPAAHRCVDCSELLCESCCMMHRKMKVSKNHHIQTLSEFKEKGVDRKLRPIYCPVHSAEKEMHELNYCCKTCNFKPICMACVMMDHTKPEHDYIPIAGVAPAQKEEIGLAVPKLDARAAALVSALGQIATTRQEILHGKAKAEREIRGRFNAIHDKLRDQEKEALNLVAAVVLDKQKRLGSQAEALACAKLSFTSCSKHIQGVLKTGADPEILLRRPVLLERSKALFQQEHTLLPEASADMWVDTNDQPLLEAIGRFCQTYVPNVSVAQCLAHGSGLEGPQVLGQAVEFVVELNTIDSKPASIGKGGNGAETMAAAVGQIVTIAAEVVEGEGGAEEEKEEEEVGGDAGAGVVAGGAGGAGGAMKPPLPPPPAIAVTSANIDDGECKYRCCYTPTVEGRLRINVRVMGHHVPGSPFSVRSTAVPLEVEFSTLGTEGREGPKAIGTHYDGTALEGAVELLDGYQRWAVPATGRYRIEAYGAATYVQTHKTGGQYQGNGAVMRGTFDLKSGESLLLLVGQMPKQEIFNGGGGGTFVARGLERADAEPLLVAGGGGSWRCDKEPSAGKSPQSCHAVVGEDGVSAGHGKGGTAGGSGSGHSGGGGSGAGFKCAFVADTSFAQSFRGGGLGGQYNGSGQEHGGFGGGGCGGRGGCGGGGGYSGGSPGNSGSHPPAGGGGSFNAGADREDEPGSDGGGSTGAGRVLIRRLLA